MFILDTDHISILQSQAQPEFGRLGGRIGLYPRTAFYFTIVSFHEQMMGANVYVNRARANQGVIRGYLFFGKILADYAVAQVLPFDNAAIAAFDSLRQQGIRLGTMD